MPVGLILLMFGKEYRAHSKRRGGIQIGDPVIHHHDLMCGGMRSLKQFPIHCFVRLAKSDLSAYNKVLDAPSEVESVSQFS